jgi:ABC-2 type transport system permease protein
VTAASRAAASRAAASRAGAEPADLPRLPSTVALSLARGGLEIRSFFRQRDQVVFTFALPVVLLLIFGQIFHGNIGHTDISFRQYFAAGIIATGIMSVTFVNLGVAIAIERDSGALKRLAGTSMPPAAYFAGKAISALVIAALEVAIVIGTGVALLGLRLPDTAGKWLTFGWVFLLGVVTCSLLGIAVSSVPRSAPSASAVINLPYLVLSFISGVYFVFSSLPQSLQHIAALFPLKWMCQGLRSVFLPAGAQVAEPAHSWELGQVALVLAAWLVISLVLCMRTFRWRQLGER